MDRVIISAIDRSKFDPKIVYIEIMAESEMRNRDILNAIEKACQEYYVSCEEKEYVGSYEDFDYDDFKKYVPNDICEKYGISKIEDDRRTIEVKNEAIVEDQVLEEEYLY